MSSLFAHADPYYRTPTISFSTQRHLCFQTSQLALSRYLLVNYYSLTPPTSPPSLGTPQPAVSRSPVHTIVLPLLRPLYYSHLPFHFEQSWVLMWFERKCTTYRGEDLIAEVTPSYLTHYPLSPGLDSVHRGTYVCNAATTSAPFLIFRYLLSY